MDKSSEKISEKILFFDGYCSLCNNTVDILMRADKGGSIKFASLQGETARARLANETRDALDPDTVIYLRDGVSYYRSTAALMVLKDLGGWWKTSSLFFAVPRLLRDLVYRFVVRIRYRVFGKRETCRLPSPQERERLLP